MLAVAPVGSSPAIDTVTKTIWPACGWHVVDDTTAARLGRMYVVRESLKQVSAEKIAATCLLWREVDSPLLETLLPGTKWYLVDVSRDEIGRTPCYPIAVRGGVSYSYRELNRLLLATGLAPDTSRFREAAQVAVLFTLLDESAIRFETRPSLPLVYRADDFLPFGWSMRSGTSRVALGEEVDTARVVAQRKADSANHAHYLDSIALTKAIPEVEFGKIGFEPTSVAESDTAWIRVPCEVGGRRREFLFSVNHGELGELKDNGVRAFTFDPVSPEH